LELNWVKNQRLGGKLTPWDGWGNFICKMMKRGIGIIKKRGKHREAVLFSGGEKSKCTIVVKKGIKRS